MFVIFAPHIDDETIGCYSILKSGNVKTIYYFFDVTDNRLNEAYNLREKLNLNYEICVLSIDKIVNIDEGDIILVPNINDTHPHHKLVNLYAKKNYKNKKYFYSIDMNVKKNVLDIIERENKKSLLFDIFVSQHILLNTDEKYFLFESILDTDNTEVYKIKIKLNNKKYIIKSDCITTIETIKTYNNSDKDISELCYLCYTSDCTFIEYKVKENNITKKITLKF